MNIYQKAISKLMKSALGNALLAGCPGRGLSCGCSLCEIGTHSRDFAGI